MVEGKEAFISAAVLKNFEGFFGVMPAHGLNHDKENDEILINILSCQPLAFFENEQVSAAALVEQLAQIVALVSELLDGLRINCFTWNDPHNKTGFALDKKVLISLIASTARSVFPPPSVL